MMKLQEIFQSLQQIMSRLIKDLYLSASTLCLQDQGSGALAKIVGEVANVPVVCGVLGTQLLLIGAMASGDHSCGSKDLART